MRALVGLLATAGTVAFMRLHCHADAPYCIGCIVLGLLVTLMPEDFPR